MNRDSASNSLDKARMNELCKQLEGALATSSFPWWEWNIPENRVTFNGLKVSMLGYDPADFKDAGYQAFTRLLHADDYERTMQAMRDHLEGRAPIYQIDYRIRRADGVYQWYMDRGCTLARGSNNDPILLRGLVMDLGEEFHRRSQDAVLLDLFRKALPEPGREDSLITICCVCPQLKIAENRWVTAAEAVLTGFKLNLSHGICGDCLHTLYPENPLAGGPAIVRRHAGIMRQEP